MIAIEVRRVGFTYPGGVRALDGVDLSVGPGETLGIIGQNGSGKSTLLFALCGLRRPNRGSVGLRAVPATGEAAGRAVEEFRDPSRLRSNEIAVRIGLVFQDPELGFVARTARDEVAAAAGYLMPQCLCDMGFPYSDGSIEDDGLPGVEPA